ncbi:MAG: hypothetical protein AB7I32_06300 [Gammaproteobacteria bacterium]
MSNDKAQVMILLKEAIARGCLATALDVVTRHTRAGGPDWACIRDAVDAMLADVRGGSLVFLDGRRRVGG